MSSVTMLYAFLFYAASAVLIIGVARKISIYARTPQPLKIPTTPAPITKAGVAWRMAKEVTVFESLFKSSKWTWLFGFMFHAALLLAFFRHLRYALSPESFLWPIINLEMVQAFGKYAGFVMVIGLLGLFGRRIFVDRVRYISSPSDYAMLLLIIGIAVTGLLMSFVEHTDIVMLKAFLLSLIYFDFNNIQAMPTDTILMVHLGLVIFLMFIFPISKLLHAPGVFFSPTRNQADNPRERRHIDGWTADDSATTKTY
jgi:nitrate reductase gamma subunit